MKYQKGNTMLFIMGTWVLAFIGWALNIYHLYGAIVSESWAPAVIRGIGVFMAPLGAVLGYIPF